MKIGCSGAENLSESICCCGHWKKLQQKPLVFGNGRFAYLIVNNPPENEVSNAHTDGHRRRKGDARACNEVHMRIPVVHNAQEAKSGDPGEISLPFKPVQCLWKLLWCTRVLEYLIEMPPWTAKALPLSLFAPARVA